METPLNLDIPYSWVNSHTLSKVTPKTRSAARIAELGGASHFNGLCPVEKMEYLILWDYVYYNICRIYIYIYNCVYIYT